VKQKGASTSAATKSNDCGCEKKTEGSAAKTEECPVQTKKYQNPKVYNVYSQEIDPKNMMPSTANQQQAPGQTVDLPVERVSSSIPKGGTDSTWQYPSPQMFWNALVRKGKTEGVSEEDMINVVRIHNNMNENTWLQVLEWEKLHPAPKDMEGTEPRLLRFLGRPDEYSPKARLKMVLGHSAPFDRHDWIVDRGGKQVRYVIDYYHDEANADTDSTPAHMRDNTSIRSIKVDARPALDSMEAIFDRIIKMPLRRFTNETDYRPLPLLPPSETVIAEKRKKLQMEKAFLTIRETCVAEKDLLTACKGQKECENASIALQRCTAGVVCPGMARDFDLAVRAQPINQEKLESSYSSMVKCLELFEMDARKTFSKQ
jgi:cytochrome c heme-lyase